MPEYEFTQDYVTRNMVHWPKFPEPIRAMRALEIGSFEGRSAIWMLDNILTHADSRLTCIDHWQNPEIERRFDKNIYLSGHSVKLQKIKEDAWRALTRLAYGFDLIYIDGPKESSALLEAAVWAFRLLKPAGYLIFDDYEWKGASVSIPPKPAIDGFLAAYEPAIEVLRKAWQVIIRKK